MYRHIIFIVITTTLLMLGACSSTSDDSHDNKVVEDKDESTPVVTEEKEQDPMLDMDLQKGDQGNAIKLLQDNLIELGYPIETTELYDEKTVWAVTDFQLQSDGLYITGIYDAETKEVIERFIEEDTEISVGTKLPIPTGSSNNEHGKIVENPYEILSLVNKQNALPSDYIPEDLVVPNVRFPFTEDLPKKQLRKVAADALEELFQVADEAGLDLFAQSGYRSYDRQDAIFAANVTEHGEDAANNFSARPGESEHQSGLTMDITSADVNFNLNIEFGETEEGKWVQQHASDFGFIIRYPLGKEDITKYQYEPWHLRYVGKRAAEEIMEKGITLEEYLNE